MAADGDAAKDFDPRRPFTRAEFVAAGRKATSLNGVRYRRVLRSVHVLAEAWDARTMIQAALKLHPEGAFASHWSAAEVLSLPVPDNPFLHVTVRDPDDRRYRPEIKCHVTKRHRGVLLVDGVWVTDPVTTFLQMAGVLSLVDLVVLGDAIVRLYRIPPRKLLEAAQRSSDYYAAAARRGASFVRKGVDSPMETRLRMLIVLAGLPEPRVNVRLVREDGTWRRRFDLCYPRIKLVIEYDGRHHAENKVQWRSDLIRREELEDDGFRILVVTSDGIYKEPLHTLHRIRRQLVLRGWGSVPCLGEDWREHFAA
jgi:very-short-patch-repair endonuclease